MVKVWYTLLGSDQLQWCLVEEFAYFKSCVQMGQVIEVMQMITPSKVATTFIRGSAVSTFREDEEKVQTS